MSRTKLDGVMKDIFHNVQFNKTCHSSNVQKLKKLYERYDLPVFWESFVTCFRVPLSISQRHPRVENTLEFVGKFAVCFNNFSDDNGTLQPISPFLVELFDFLLTHHQARDPSARFRICYFLNTLLNSMGDQAFIEDDLCDKITCAMMDRLLDRSSKVRKQAIFALHRLQDPSDEDCPVIKTYIYHASKDPKAEVRKAALMSMGKNQRTLEIALRRTRDVDATVRKAAYEFISKVTVRSLTIKQRDTLLNDGLRDRSNIVKRSVENNLLPGWLRHFNGEYICLVKALDAEMGTEASVLALQTLFEASNSNTLLEQVPINRETKLIPVDLLCSENALYWKCLVKYLHRKTCTDELETIIPELSNFCSYITDFITITSSKEYENWERDMKMFILLQLFEMAMVYDLSDEVGRKKLHDLMFSTLMGDHYSEKIIECIVTHLVKVIPDADSRLDALANLISEIRLPLEEPVVPEITEEQQHTINMRRAKLKVKLLELKEEEYQAIQEQQYLKADSLKNEINAISEEIKKLSVQPDVVVNDCVREEKSDATTMKKCLSIICTMMQSVTVLTPTLRNLLEIAVGSLDHPDDNVHVLALKAVSIYCILDKELAEKYIMMLFLEFAVEQENSEIWIVALKGIFDLLVLYGLECFKITGETGETEPVCLREGGSRDFVQIIAGLLDNADQGLRTIATEGLCKLLLHQRISSAKVLSKLIILSFNPMNDNDFYLRQCLSGFFANYVIRVPDAQASLEEVYLPTLKILCKAPETSPLQEIDPYNVSKFIINLTARKSNEQSCNVHNNLAFTILAETLNPNTEIFHETLIKSLKDLHVEIDDNGSKKSLREASKNLSKMIMTSDKRLSKYIDLFLKKLDSPNAVEPSTSDDTDSDDLNKFEC